MGKREKDKQRGRPWAFVRTATAADQCRRACVRASNHGIKMHPSGLQSRRRRRLDSWQDGEGGPILSPDLDSSLGLDAWPIISMYRRCMLSAMRGMSHIWLAPTSRSQQPRSHAVAVSYSRGWPVRLESCRSRPMTTAIASDAPSKLKTGLGNVSPWWQRDVGIRSLPEESR